MTIEEAKVIAVLGERAPLGMVQEALDVLFLEVRRLENEKVQAVEPRCNC